MTIKELKKELDYDFKSGVFTWKNDKTTRVKAGDIAGTLKNGYIRIRVGKKAYYAHRLAWLYVYGYVPKEHIDHINHNRADNRIKNLRVVSNNENHKNMKQYKNNSSGYVGVYWIKSAKRWRARINVDGNYINLGNFASFSDAVDARKNAEVLYGFHKNHGT